MSLAFIEADSELDIEKCILCRTVIEGEELKSNEKDINEVAGIKIETFKYWDNLVEYFTIAMNLIRGDGEAMWNLHLDSMQKAVKLFEIMDSTNYERWGETYLEDMRRQRYMEHS